MKKICTICARGGSKGIKNKNLISLLGKPLISYTIKQAIESKEFDCIVVSSDSPEILDTAKKYGATYTIMRPIELASDEAAKIPAIQHCVRAIEEKLETQFDIIVDLDATAPLRLPSDISQVIKFLMDHNAMNVITGSLSRHSPYFNLVELNENGDVFLSKTTNTTVVRRQDSPKCYDLNGSIYAWKRDALFENANLFKKNTRLYIMPNERSVDIDSELDFQLVELLMQKKLKISNASQVAEV